jgi:type I phosphodiesterase/nucleotide pyrophosphatase
LARACAKEFQIELAAQRKSTGASGCLSFRGGGAQVTKEVNIFVLVDALGWESVRGHPFLQTVAPYRRRLESVLGYSTAAIPSILSGRYPDQHGRMSLFHRAIGRSPFASIKWLCEMPPALVENRYVRYGAREYVRRLHHFGGWFHFLGIPLRHLPQLDVSEKRDIYRPGGIPETGSIFDLLEARQTNYAVYTYHDGSNSELIDRMKADLRKGENSFCFLYLDGVDAFLHRHANDPAAVDACLESYSALIADLYESARSHYSDVRLHVFGDHGMAPTRKVVNIQNRLEGLRVRAPEDYLYVLDSTMARFWFFSESARDEVMSVFREEDGGEWLDEKSLRSLRAWFEDRRYGQEIYLMPEGTVIVGSGPREMVPSGMHGFHPSTLHSPSAFVSSVDYGNRLNHITDVYGVMTECL